jgi:myosin V
MGTMGFDPKTQEDIFGVCAAFLHASNLTFLAVTDDSSKVDDSNPHLKAVLRLLGLESTEFQNALCQFEIEAGSTSYTRTVNKDYALKGLEALIKATYGAMFNFIVQSINKKIEYKLKRGEGRDAGKAAFIGVLDIFGFESFKKNSFEQLCINYCNEALQQQFNMYIFKSEQEEYQREGIAWEFIEFPDNQDVIDLIDKKPTGIISILTDQCVTARGSDKLFADAMYKQCEAHNRFEASSLQKGSLKFVINHYAGPVVYDTLGFVEKNKDEVPRGTTTLLENSSNQFVQLLGKINAPSTTISSGGRGANKRPTIGGQFALQLTELRKRIGQTSPHYIRCLKPNQSLAASEFDNAMIADQLRYAGVLEAIRVSRVGYSQRYSLETFVERYRFIALTQLRSAADEEKAGILASVIAQKIFDSENPNAAPPADLLAAVGIQKGQTKMFLRQGAYDYMERFRTQQLSISAVKIESVVRRFLGRCRYLGMQKRIVLVQSCTRRFLARKHLRGRRELKAAVKIQSHFRRYPIRNSFVEKKYIAIWFQKMSRGKVGRAHYAELYALHQQEVAKENTEYKAAVLIQCMKRSRDARAVKAALEAEKEKGEQVASFLGEHSETVKILRAQQVSAALKADKASAVAKETKQEANKEVELLMKELEKARIVVDREKATREEAISLRAQLDAVMADLEVSRSEESKAKSRLLDLQEENKKLKEQMKVGVFVAGKPYTSTHYDDHEDLKLLDQRIYGISTRSKQSKKDLEALVQSLAILR